MNKEDFIKDEETEILNNESDKYYRSSGSIKQEVLSEMTDSDIAQIIGDKRKEWGWIEIDKKISIKGLRGNNRKILESVFLDEQEKINKLTKGLMYVLKSRTTQSGDGFTSEDLERAKESISIVDVIEIIAGIKIHNTRQLIRCPFPNHKDSTPSLKIYSNTNSFFCQGCHKGGSQIDFIMNMCECDLATAIKQFLQFYKR